ncbi:hypothetical protein [Pelagicoccus mobilis]|uniref:Uncharacterized protein n=1 Tax=Pelagicoccus mobilis TaxID=415221 RepID=A0A934S2G0_9BACT|nr:hypothetical protein [Pelagicoccus mobilis]MBK1879854.1 hypothetical protein [Pelagicoccus mobilis]
MHCVIHIGTEKTATTTIQEFLTINKPKLAELGILYPKSSGKTGSRNIAVSAYGDDRRDDLTTLFAINSSESLSEFRKNTLDELESEIEAHSTTHPFESLVVSSEHIQSRLTTTEEIQRLKTHLTQLGASSFTILVYLRSPAEIANSRYSTHIKSGGTLDSPREPTHPYYQNLCNHKATLLRYASIFGGEQVIPKLFDKTELIDGCILSDFRDAVGISSDVQLQTPQNSNQSLSHLGIQILKQFNKRVPRFLDGKPNPLRDYINFYFEKHFAGSKYQMPESLREKFNQEFAESNEWVRQTHFPHRETLFPKETRPDHTLKQPDDSLDAKQLGDFLAHIWLDKSKGIRTGDPDNYIPTFPNEEESHKRSYDEP